MKKAVILASFVLFTAVVITTAWFVTPKFERIDLSKMSPIKEGSLAPDFEISSLEGDNFKLSDCLGKKLVLLFFWASWCPSCLEAKEELGKLKATIGGDKLKIVAINIGIGDSYEKVKKMQQKNRFPGAIYYDSGGKVSKRYGVSGVPFFVLINKGGQVIYAGHEIPKDIENVVLKEEAGT